MQTILLFGLLLAALGQLGLLGLQARLRAAFRRPVAGEVRRRPARTDRPLALVRR